MFSARAQLGEGPPAADSGTVRAALRRILPPALSKVSFPEGHAPV